MSDVMTVEEARAVVFDLVSALPAERVDLLDALGRVLAEPCASDIDVSPFDNSAMDGFAVRREDLAGAMAESPVVLEVIAHIGAGSWWDGEVGPGTAARIMTGAPLPAGADAVVMVERTQVESGDGGVGSRVAFEVEPKPGEHIRKRGEEVRAGEVVLEAGEVIGPAAIGLLAATGHASVMVHRRPRVAVVATGSELVEVTEVPGPGKIRNSNSYSVSAQVIAAGGIPVRYPIVLDDREITKAAFLKAAEEADFIVTSGGVSVGDFDYVRPVLEEIGDLTFCKVKMRPGNPQTLGTVRGVPFFGLPGNPTSTYVGFEIFLRPALRIMQGFTELDRPVVTATLAHDIKKKQDRRYYLRGRVEPVGDGYSVSLSGGQSSALLRAAHHGNCLVILPEGEGFFAVGTEVPCMRLDQEEGAR